jgi:hypothetical protein
MYGSVLGAGEAVGRAMRAKSKRLKRSNILIFSRESLRSLLLLLALQHKEGSVRHWKAVLLVSWFSHAGHVNLFGRFVRPARVAFSPAPLACGRLRRTLPSVQLAITFIVSAHTNKSKAIEKQFSFCSCVSNSVKHTSFASLQ